MGLQGYKDKRDFTRTPEPPGRVTRTGGNTFVVQKHAARRLHYDFRLELDGVLMSWAVPKGPSLNPKNKRLAVHVEDHPLEYAAFEGTIPKKEYGGGTVMIWDAGTWEPLGDAAAMVAAGRLEFRLHGEKLKGAWILVRTKAQADKGQEHWLLMKKDDEEAMTGEEIVATRPEDPAGAPKADLPDWIAPALCTAVTEAPEDAAWLHEIKLDGYRILARLSQGKVQLWSRNRKDWTERFAALAAAIATLPADAAWLDGEVVALGASGVSDFSALKEAISEKKHQNLFYFVFDLLHLDGQDLRPLPLHERKALLGTLLAKAPTSIRFTDHVEGQGGEFWRSACEMGLEGSIAKRRDAPYRSERGRTWLKIKCKQSEELVIVGYTAPSGSRTAFGALVLATRDGAQLRYAGRVGTGFTETGLRELHQLLVPLQRKTRPAMKHPPTAAEAKGVQWVRPQLVAQVAFSQWTADGRLRHATYKGLREDKSVAELARERPLAPAQRPRLTNPDRVLYPEIGLTKLDLLAHYERVAERMLPHVTGRLLTLVRCPSGHQKGCFYQKHGSENMPDAVRSLLVQQSKGPAPYLYVEDAAGLLSLVQMGVLELHPWGSRVADLEHPDLLVMDLDPAPDLDWDAVVQAARRVRQSLKDKGMDAWVKTTGGKGLHVVSPLRPETDWAALKAFCQALAVELARAEPEHYTSKASKAGRAGRVYIDWLRNARGATAVAPWSTRARPGAPVAVPVRWEELGRLGRADGIRVADIAARLRRADPWADMAQQPQSLPR